jgi:hypothetical protein
MSGPTTLTSESDPNHDGQSLDPGIHQLSVPNGLVAIAYLTAGSYFDDTGGRDGNSAAYPK